MGFSERPGLRFPLTRQCGDCQLCCKLLPMHARDQRNRAGRVVVEKEAGERCPHQRYHVGCTVYEHRPWACEMWNCRWLVNDDTADLPRPDRCHYVIDIMPDIIRMVPNDGSPPSEVLCVVVWVDPGYRDAHRDPALRRYLARRAKADGMPAIIRWSEQDGMVLFAPSLSENGKWNERMVPPTPGFKNLHERMRDGLGRTS